MLELYVLSQQQNVFWTLYKIIRFTIHARLKNFLHGSNVTILFMTVKYINETSAKDVKSEYVVAELETVKDVLLKHSMCWNNRTNLYT